MIAPNLKTFKTKNNKNSKAKILSSVKIKSKTLLKIQIKKSNQMLTKSTNSPSKKVREKTNLIFKSATNI
jgi:hypothetical protein